VVIASLVVGLSGLGVGISMSIKPNIACGIAARAPASTTTTVTTS
jgi:F0F1-type ATP synthase membrane subunit c/vacuolar-type H+-ATPase subunit K